MNFIFTQKVRLVLLFLVSVSFSACNNNDDEGSNPGNDLNAQAVSNYGDMVLASYEDSRTKALELDAALRTLVNSPSESTLEAARKAWIDSRPAYLQTEAYRFYAGPIDDDAGPEGALNAWPMDEVYVDYVEGNPDAGIVNRTDLYPELTAELLRELNEKDGEANVSTGYHAIEFLLWGQDLNASPGDAGKRPATDYSTAANADRRGVYLLTVSEMLIEDLDYLIDAWQPGGNNYRSSFEELTVPSLRKMMTGIKELVGGELGGERMEVAYISMDQEDEHSCFSDNTHNDHIYDMQGIINVYTGSYTRTDGSTISGASLSDIIKAADSDVDAQITAQLELCRNNVNAIGRPFDEAILGPAGREHIRETVNELQKLADMLLTASDLIQ